MSALSHILLGFEVETCSPVFVDPDHLIITGQTQMAGKTLTLNALNTRSKRRCIAFRTKRGEMEFDVTNTLKPFYTEPKTQRSKYISWQYVKSILESSQGRGMNFEEAMKSFKSVAPAQGESVHVSLTHESPSLEVTLIRKRLEADTLTSRGKLLYLYSVGAFGVEPFSVSDANRFLGNNGWNKSPRTKQYLDEMMEWGFLKKIPSGKRYGYQVLMTPEEATKRNLLSVNEKVIE